MFAVILHMNHSKTSILIQLKIENYHFREQAFFHLKKKWNLSRDVDLNSVHDYELLQRSWCRKCCKDNLRI